MNGPARVELEEGSVPDGNEEYFFYQTLVSVWPYMRIAPAERRVLLRRIQDYMHKAAKEAKLRTSWVSPNQPHEQALMEFVRLVLQPHPTNVFLADFLEFQRPVAIAGMLNSLSQMVLKICAPGIPDFFQGTELWDDSLVDPDNRRPVDFAARRAILAEIARRASENPHKVIEELLADLRSARIKVYLARCALNFRREHPELFASGAYIPLKSSGAREQHVVAFARRYREQHMIVMVGRFFMRLGGGSLTSVPDGSAWRDTTLALPQTLDHIPNRYVDLFTGGLVDVRLDESGPRLPIDQVFTRMPVAMLTPSN
jgi:(1->4)-alpha-D-glucan 1-alpha-D-glucosylmutase